MPKKIKKTEQFSYFPKSPVKSGIRGEGIMRFGKFTKIFKGILIGFVISSLFSFGLYVLADPPSSPYNPGSTLNPSCSPGSTNCTVTAPVPYTGATTTLNIGSQDFTTTATGTFGTITDGTLSINGGSLTTSGNGTFNTVTVTTITDGTASLTGGSLTAVKLGSLTTDGFVVTSLGDGTLSIDTTSYEPLLGYTAANIALSNLASVAINTALLPDTAGGV